MDDNRSSILVSPDAVVSMGVYHPFRNGNNPEFDNFSSLIIDFKNGKHSAVVFFHNLATEFLARKDCAICIIPSHSPKKSASSVRKLAKLLCVSQGISDATDCLIRTREIPKLACGGDRSIDLQIESMELRNCEVIAGKQVLLMDDVTTTGNSLVAGKKLLLDAGAAHVQCLVLGKTAKYNIDLPF